jgi:CRISPR-associated protein Csm3
MSENTLSVNLYGRVFIRGNIKVLTGLHIGSPGTMSIGGVDNAIIRDPLTNRPYIPGSSLRGKLRSLWEKLQGASLTQYISSTKGKEVRIHVCNDPTEYAKCLVCPIYGVPGDKPSSSPTRLIVRDTFIDDETAEQLDTELRTDLPLAEVKWETAIDRVTSAATPRPIERIPAGVTFTNFEMIYSIYEAGDLDRFIHVIDAMQLLEDDYLGGLGSRGSGKICFTDIELSVRATRPKNNYRTELCWRGSINSVAELLARQTELQNWLREKISLIPYDNQGHEV